MTGEGILRLIKRKVTEEGWLEDTGVGFEDVYLQKSDDAVPFALLVGFDLHSQIKRKFYYPFDTLGDVLAKDARRLGNLKTEPMIFAIIDVTYDDTTAVYLIWGERNLILTYYYRRSSDFIFANEREMGIFLHKKYLEGLTVLKESLRN